MQPAWAYVGSGFAFGAVVYYSVTLFLENKGAAVRLSTRFHEYAVGRKQQDVKERLELLSKCDLRRHLPPAEIEAILPYVRPRRLDAGGLSFRAGDQGDALYIVAHGSVKVLADCQESATTASRPIATLGEGQAFGEMALLTGGARTATIRAAANTELLEIGKGDFEQLVKERPAACQCGSTTQPRAGHQQFEFQRTRSFDLGAEDCQDNFQNLSRNEAHTLLVETGHGAGLAIVLGNILDTIPGCLVIGAKFKWICKSLANFDAGDVSRRNPGSRGKRVDAEESKLPACWNDLRIMVMCFVAGVIAAVAGKLLIGSPYWLIAIFCQAIAGGAVLALVVHAMICEKPFHGGGSVCRVADCLGFLFALYLALLAAF